MNYGRTESSTLLSPFWMSCYILNIKDSLRKFDSKSNKGTMIGYSETFKAFRVYNSRICKVEEVIHVKFNDFKHKIKCQSKTRFLQMCKIAIKL